LVGVVTRFHGEIGTLDDVTEPLDAKMDRTGFLNIGVEPWEQVESKFFQYSII